MINSFNLLSNFKWTSPEIEFAEINEIIKSMKPFKAPGQQSIQNILLKNLPISAIERLTVVINKCIQLSHWPISFKTAKVITNSQSR